MDCRYMRGEGEVRRQKLLESLRSMKDQEGAACPLYKGGPHLTWVMGSQMVVFNTVLLCGVL